MRERVRTQERNSRSLQMMLLIGSIGSDLLLADHRLHLMDMFCSFFGIIGDPSKGYFCYAQGYTTHFFCIASFLWTTMIAFTLHRTVVRHKTDVEDLEPMFHLYAWGTSGVVTVVRSIGKNHHGHISRVGTWCWAQTGLTGQVVHFLTFYAPLWGAILFNGFTYFQVIRMLNNATRMAVGMSERGYQSDARPDMKFNPVNDEYFISGSIDERPEFGRLVVVMLLAGSKQGTSFTAVSYRPDGQAGIIGSIASTCHLFHLSDNQFQLGAQMYLTSKKFSFRSMNFSSSCFLIFLQ